MTSNRMHLFVSVLALGIAMTAGAEEAGESMAPSSGLGSTRSINVPEDRLRDPELRAVFGEIDEALDALRTETGRLSAATETLHGDLARSRDSIAAYGRALGALEELMSGLRGDLSQLQESLLQSQLKTDRKFAGLEDADAAIDAELRVLNQRIGALSEGLAAIGTDVRTVGEALEAQSVDVQRRFRDVSGEVKDIGLEMAESYESISGEIFLRSVIGATIISALLMLGIFAGRHISRISKTSAEEVKTSLSRLHEEQNKLDLKLSEFLTEKVSAESEAGADQQFFLNVADEINRMRKRLARMPNDTKGLKPLEKALERLESGLKGQGYEIVPLLGEEYTEGLNVAPRFVPDDKLAPGTQVITDITKPQVNYHGKIVQVAEVEVSIGG